MRSPMLALIWEQWRQVQYLVLITCFGMPIASLAILAALNASSPTHFGVTQDWNSITSGLHVLALFSLMAMLLFSHSSTRNLRTVLPTRMLILPIPAARLAFTQVGFRFTAVALVSYFIGFVLSLIDPIYRQNVVPIAIACVVTYAFASAIALTVGKYGTTAAIATILITIVPVFAILNVTASFVENFSGPSSSIVVYIVVYVVFFIACTLVSLVSLMRVRHTWPMKINVITRSRTRPIATFRSVAMAPTQFRYEWRRLGWFFPSCATAFAIAVLLPSAIVTYTSRELQDVVEALTSIPYVVIPATGFVLGLFLIGRENRDAASGLLRFQWTRPVSVQQIVVARMKVVTLAMLITVLAFVGVALVASFPAGRQLHTISFGPLAALLVLTWCMIWAPHLPVAYFALLIVYAYGIVESNDTDWTSREDFLLVSLPVACSFLLLAALGYISLKRRLFSFQLVLGVALLCLALCILTIPALSALFAKNVITNAEYVPVVAAIALGFAPLHALLSQGLIQDRIRHGALFRRLPARDS